MKTSTIIAATAAIGIAAAANAADKIPANQAVKNVVLVHGAFADGSGWRGVYDNLTRRGYKVSEITTKELYDIPSYRAAGYFALVSIKTSKEEEANLAKIGIDTFKACTIPWISKSIDHARHLYRLRHSRAAELWRL